MTKKNHKKPCSGNMKSVTHTTLSSLRIMCVIDFIVVVENRFYYDVVSRKSHEGLHLDYYESIKREPKIRGKYECRCDERLQTKSKEFTRLPYTGLVLF